MLYNKSTAVMRPSSKAGADWETKADMKTQQEIKRQGEYIVVKMVTNALHFSSASHGDSALRKVHVTAEKQTEEERVTQTG